MNRGGHHLPAPGIVWGYNRVPTDKRIISQMGAMGYSADTVIKNLEVNRHTNITTVYYLLLRKHLREGGASMCDFSDPNFDRTLLEPLENKSRKASSVLGNMGNLS